MRTSSVGNSRGLTLVELLVALALAGMIMAISFPTVSAGLEGVRLQSAGRRVAAFINAAGARTEREQLPVEVVIESKRLRALAADGKWDQTVDLPEGVEIRAEELPRRLVLLPGVPPPRTKLSLRSQRGKGLSVELNPLTGAPEIGEVQ
jgi:prepilin-type N-terminal cleavage/methylation domain-containing protein